MPSRSRCKLAYSTATALLLLLSLESYTTHAASSAIVDSYTIRDTHQILTNNAKEEFARNLAGKSAKPEHKTHHGGGGKHDSGVDGHHNAKNNNGGKADKPAPASSPSREDSTGGSKSGKATAASPHTPAMVLAVSADEMATADDAEDYADPISADESAEHESAGEHMAHELELEEEAVSQHHHTSKAAKDMKEEEYVMTADDSDSEAESKAGKEDYIMSDDAGSKSGKEASSGSSGGIDSGKSGKMSYTESGKSGKAATSSSSSGSGGNSGKSGKASYTSVIKGGHMMSYETKSDKEMDPEAKVTKEPLASEDHSEVKGGSPKPKAEKQLTEWFIKEPTHGNSDGGASGKSGKSAGDHSATVASGKSGKSAGDLSATVVSGKSGKAHMSYDDSVGGGGGSTHTKAAKAVMSYDLAEETPVPAPTDGATMVPAPTDGATMVPAPTSDTPEPAPVEPDTPAPTEPATAPDGPPDEEPAVPTMPTDLLTMSPTPAPSIEDAQPDNSGNLPEPPTDDPNSKWFPAENDDGVRYCEYGSTELPEVFQFETESDCCEAFPEACPDGVQMAPPNPSDNDERDVYVNEDDEESTYPTYFPTGPPTSFKEPLLSTLDADTDDTNIVAIEPFALKYFANVAEPNWDEETVNDVTMRHLVHSFRNCINLHDAGICTQDWQLETLNLRILERERHLKHEPSAAVSSSPAAMRYLSQHPVFELIYGGVLHFPEGTSTPSVEEMEHVVEASFTHERLDYYLELLKEAGMDVKHARLVRAHELENGINNSRGEEGESSEGFNWAGLLIGMSSAFGGVALLSVGSRYYYNQRQARIDNLDLDVEKGGDYAIRLQYTNDEIEAYPGASTVAETADQLSLPSLVRGGDEEIDFLPTPGGTNSYSSSKKSNDSASISPLESPQGLRSVREEEASTRYISVFTVKKDCGGKPLDQVDLRALAIAYLSRMLRKFPNTHLLPYDKASTLPAITNIRNIPDDLEELQQYVGNARLDDRTGKVLFNLRVESDEPVSKMKSGTGSSRGMNKLKAKPYTAAPKVVDPPKPKSPSEEDGNRVVGADEDAPKSPKTPRSPVMEDVEL